MTVFAGIDVGNTTTEIVLARSRPSGLDFIDAGRCVTHGVKGSEQALRRARRLLREIEERAGVRADRNLLADQQPVLTRAVRLEGPPAQGPLASIASSVSTPAGVGFAIGTLTPLEEVPLTGDQALIIVAVPRTWDFEDSARRIADLIAAGHRIVGVFVEADEATLISNRIGSDLPIVDEIDFNLLSMGSSVALEVAPPGGTLQRLVDPIHLARLFDLPSSSLPWVQTLALELADARTAVVLPALAPERSPEAAAIVVECEAEGRSARLELPRDLAFLKSVRPGSVVRLRTRAGLELPGVPDGATTDVYAADLPGLAAGAWIREGVLDLGSAPLALLAAATRREVLGELAERVFGRETRIVGAETHAAALGALTTPGAPSDAAVCDIGGGTVDMIWGNEHRTAAGAGALLTETVASLLRISSLQAEWAKRGPAVHVESPYLARTELGDKVFLDRPADPRTIGQLCADMEGELVAFTQVLGPEEWRGLRLGLKRQILGRNIDRCLADLPGRPSSLILAGGAATDPELAFAVAAHMSRRGIVVGSADVAGRFGRRYAVAVGLVIDAVASEDGAQLLGSSPPSISLWPAT